MNDPQDGQAFAQLAEKLVPQSRLVRTWPLKGGISARMVALEIEGPDGATMRMIFRQPGETTGRQNTPAARQEFQTLRLAHALGLAAPRPLLLDETRMVFKRPYCVIEFIEGKPDFTPTNRESFARQTAEQLASIHSAGYSPPEVAFLPQQEALEAKVMEELATGASSAMGEAHIRRALGAAWPIPRRNPPALLHGDYWPGNFLWSDGRLIAVIDWEDAMLGDPLIDLAICRLDLYWIYGEEMAADFTRHYLTRLPVDTAALPYWDLYAAHRLARLAGMDLAGWAAFFAPFGRPEITEASLRRDFRRFVDRAFEQLDA